MEECRATMGAFIDPGFNFSTYNDTIRDAINISTHLIDKEPISKAILGTAPSPLRPPQNSQKRVPHAHSNFLCFFPLLQAGQIPQHLAQRSDILPASVFG